MAPRRHRRAELVFLVCTSLAAGSAIKVNWTPNGEAPAPFSQKAREAMGAAGQPAAAPKPVSPVQLALGEVASFGGLLLALVAINFGRPFVLNDLLDLSVLNKIGNRVREIAGSVVASSTSAAAAARAAAAPKVAKSKVEQSRVTASGKRAASSADAVRRARMSKLVAKAEDDDDEEEDDEEVAAASSEEDAEDEEDESASDEDEEDDGDVEEEEEEEEEEEGGEDEGEDDDEEE